ncbi:MAG: hypothetical protein JXR96_08370 [Deltaproteobacteria bacterium]|nr:hypothetical protein [Deltaproteobacteria bacterium]
MSQPATAEEQRRREERKARRAARREKRRAFLRTFRWTVYTVFLVFMGFVAVCAITGIVTNIEQRHPELDIPVERPETLAELDTLALRDCLAALETLRAEQQDHVQKAFSAWKDRDSFLQEYAAWARPWRRRFEELGVSCRLTEYSYSGHPTVGTLAEIYRRLDLLHRQHERLVKRYVIENARTVTELNELVDRARALIDETSP